MAKELNDPEDSGGMRVSIEGTRVLQGPLAMGAVTSKMRAAWCKSCRFERDEMAEVGEGAMVGLEAFAAGEEPFPLVH